MSDTPTNGAGAPIPEKGAGAAVPVADTVSASADRLDVRQQVAGTRLLVFGGTGFLGKVWLCALLYHFPEVAHVYLVVRPRKRKDGSIRQSLSLIHISEPTRPY